MASQRSGPPRPSPQPIGGPVTLQRDRNRSVGHDGDVTATAPAGAPDPTAVVGRRFGAVAIDIGILWAFSATFWVFASREAPTGLSRFGGPCEGRGLCTNVNDRYVQGWPMVVLTLVWVAYLVGVFVVQRGLTGRTVGTMLTGVVVVGDDGRPLGVGKGLLRSVAGVVDYLPCCLPIVGVVTILASPGHDQAAARRRLPASLAQ